MAAYTKISPSAARAVLTELQNIADDRAKAAMSLDDGTFARVVLASLTGSLEARLPMAEWNRVDVFRARRGE